MPKAPEYSDSKMDLIGKMRATEGSGARQFDIAKAILDIKVQEEIADQTKSLRFATWGLFFATAGLVIATVALIFVTAYK